MTLRRVPRPRPAGASFLLGAMLGCASEPEGPRVSAVAAPLEFASEWLRPDHSPETDWITYPIHLLLDPTTGHLFLQDRDWKTVVEVDGAGRPLRSWGRPGQGPGEIGHHTGFAIDGDRVYVLDLGNFKILLFRRTGELESELRIENFYYDIEVVDGYILLVPGKDHAIDIFDSEGRLVEGVGDRESLPGACSGCSLSVLDDGRIVVLYGNRPEMLVFDRVAPHPVLVDMYQMPLLQAWRDELADHLRRIQRMGGGRAWMGTSLEPAGPSQVLVIAAPPDVTTAGRELWRVDVDTGDIDRYAFGDPHLGFSLAVDWPRVFTTSFESGAVVELRVPGQTPP